MPSTAPLLVTLHLPEVDVDLVAVLGDLRVLPLSLTPPRTPENMPEKSRNNPFLLRKGAKTTDLRSVSGARPLRAPSSRPPGPPATCRGPPRGAACPAAPRRASAPPPRAPASRPPCRPAAALDLHLADQGAAERFSIALRLRLK